MRNSVNHRRQSVSAVAILAAVAMISSGASASDFSRFAQADAAEPIPFVEETSYPAARPAEVAVLNELGLKNNLHPPAVAPLPPAILTGSGLLIGNWVLRKMFKRRWI